MTISQALNEIESGHDLAHYAALAAAQELAQNWRAAITAGEKLSAMLSDVDRTIEALREFKMLLQGSN